MAHFWHLLQHGREESINLGAAPDSELLVVKLRRLHQYFYNTYVIPESQENVFSSADLMLAIEYMVNIASSLRMPLSICIGLGTNMSGHDGFSIGELYIDRVSLVSGVCICIAAR